MQTSIQSNLGYDITQFVMAFFRNGERFNLYQKGNRLYTRVYTDEEILEAIKFCCSSEIFRKQCPEIYKRILAYIAPTPVVQPNSAVQPLENVLQTSPQPSSSTERHVFNPNKANAATSKITQKTRKPNASQLAEAFLENFFVRIYLETIYILISSYYRPFTENEFYRLLNMYYRGEAEKVGTTKLYVEITNFIKCDNRYVISDDRYLALSHFICFLDGYLNTDTMVFLPPDPNIFFRTYINLKFNDVQSSVNTTVFDEYLTTITGNDKALLIHILEMIGLCMSNDMSAKALFLLQGVGNSGKSTLISLIAGLFNDDLVSALNIDDIGQQFSISEIFGKALNVSAEVGDAPLSTKTVRKLKELTGGDLLSADVKFKSCIKFRNTAKIIVATNNMLLTEKSDVAFQRRIVVIPFKYTIPNKYINYNLLNQLRCELPGIAKKAINAYIKLRERNYIFTGNYKLNDVCQESLNITEIQPNYLNVFLESMVLPGSPNDYISIGHLFELYKRWLSKNNFPLSNDTCSDLAFGKALRNIYPQENFKKSRIPNAPSSVSCLFGYKIAEQL